MDGEIKQKSGFWKFSLKFIAIIILALAAGWGFAQYRQYLGEKDVERLAEGLKQWEKDEYARAMADTYGGKTPQETLQMYIDAVEKGDYELASKYFVLSEQENEKKTLLEADKKKNIDFLLSYLIKTRDSNGYFSTDKNRFTIEKPIFVELILYPNGIWKIIKI